MNRIVIHAATVKGAKLNNEDCLYVNGWFNQESGASNQCYQEELDNMEDDNDPRVVAVADGVSSSDNSDEASFLVMQSLDNWLTGKSHKAENAVAEICECFDICNRELVSYAEQKSKRMATTLTMLLTFSNTFYIANIGDSPAFLIRDKKMIQLYEEQTLGEFLRIQDGLSPDMAQDNTLISYLGNEDVDVGQEVHITEGRLKEGDKILLCSDGLTKALDRKMIMRYLLSQKKGFRKMLDKIGNRQKDNCTVVLVEFN